MPYLVISGGGGKRYTLSLGLVVVLLLLAPRVWAQDDCCAPLSRFRYDLHAPDTAAHPSLLKTNVLGWAQSQANAAYEVELRRGWTVWLGADWSAMNYGSWRLHFRTLRFTLGAHYTHKGFFVGPHIGLAWYNYAYHGTYRYQDVGGHTPAYGLGVDGGYRHALGRRGRWMMEYGAGLGVYRLHYDRFVNRHNGPRVDTRRRVLPLLDVLSVSVAYRFKGKKGGKR